MATINEDSPRSGTTRVPGSIALVVPSYGHAAYIQQTLESLLRQTRAPDEIIVINDGSPDDTATAVSPYLDRIAYLEQPNRGLVATINRGIELASSDYVMVLASDDWLEDDALARLGTVLDGDAAVGFVHGRRQMVDEHGVDYPGKIGPSFPLGTNRDTVGLIRSNYVSAPAVLCRRQAVIQAGLFRDYPYCQDWAMWLAIALDGWSIHGLDRNVAFYRRHSGNLTVRGNTSKILRDDIAMLGDLWVAYEDRLTAAERRAFAWSIGRLRRDLGWSSLADGDRGEARASFVAAVRRGVDRGALAGLLVAVAPRRVYALVNARRDLPFSPRPAPGA